MIVVNNETLDLIKQDIDRDNMVFAGSTIAQYIESKNPHENITLALRSIKEDLKEILSHYPESFYFGQIHFNLLHEVFKEMHWNADTTNVELNGCENNATTIVEVPNKDFYYRLDYSWYNPFTRLEKIYKDEKESNNC